MTPNSNTERARPGAKTKAAAPAKRMLAIVSGKGGVGKSFTGKLLLDTARSEGIKIAAYDADGAVGGLVRLYGTRADDGGVIESQDPMEGVAFYDLRSDRDRNTLLDSIGLNAPVILHDLPGGSTIDMQRIVDGGEGVGGFLDALELHGVRLTLLHVVDNEIESAQSVGSHLDLFGDRADHIAILNMRECKSINDFPYWIGYDVGGKRRYGKARERLLGAGGVEVQMPALPPATRAKVNALRLQFSKATQSDELTITEKAHVAKLLRDFAANLEPARSVLGF